MDIIAEQLDEPVQNIEWSKVYWYHTKVLIQHYNRPLTIIFGNDEFDDHRAKYFDVLTPIRAHKNRAKIRRRKYYCYTRYIRERKLNKAKFDKVMKAMKALPNDYDQYLDRTEYMKVYDKQIWSNIIVKRIKADIVNQSPSMELLHYMYWMGKNEEERNARLLKTLKGY